MNKKIGILHLEDSFKDFELIQSVIQSGGIEHEYFLVDNEKDFIDVLETKNIDIILSDYSLPSYNGTEVLKLAREKYAYIPFIFVSGIIGEDAAISTMLNGATDIVFKNKLRQLIPVIKRALYEHEQKLKIKLLEAGEALIKSEIKYKDLVNEVSDGYFVTNNQGIITFANISLAKIFGFISPEEMTGRLFTEFNKKSDTQDVSYNFKNIIKNKKKINLKSLTEGVFDTTSPMGEAIFQIIAILKAMEVNVLRERTVKGLEAARLEGRIGGRPARSYNKKKASAVVTLYKQKESINFIEETLNISRSTIYKYLRREGVVIKGFKKISK